MSFKETLQQDFDRAWLDPLFFGEEHQVEGKSIICVLEDEHGTARQDAYGVSEFDAVLHAKTEDLPERKASGNGLLIDDRYYLIVDWKEAMGMASVSLSRSEAM